MARWNNCEWCGKDMIEGKSIFDLELKESWFSANRHFCSRRCVKSAYRDSLRSSSTSSSCFVATAVYGDQQHPAVVDLRLFRDNHLRKTKVGTSFINWYYVKGEAIANFIDKSSVWKTIAYLLIVKPIHTIVKLFNLK
jgi:hypothetical protein